MRLIKLTASYKEKDEFVRKVVTIPIPISKEEDVFDFEAFLVSKSESFIMSVISSNVSVLTWRDDEEIPTEKMARMAFEVDSDLLVITCPRLPETLVNVMVFCPQSMEKFISNGGFVEIFNEIRYDYESLYWTAYGSKSELIVYLKDGNVETYKGK